MPNFVLQYTNAGQLVEEKIESFSHLLARLDSIGPEFGHRHGVPYGVDLVRDEGGRLVIGVGNEQWILMFIPADEDNEPIVYSFGDPTETGRIRVYFGDVSLMSRKYLIARADALRAIQTWFDEGRLGDAVRWTETIY